MALAPTRDRILDGATRAVARHGVAKLDMADVSVTSGVSRGTLYRYFPSRDALLAELALREGTLFRERLLAAVAAVPSGPERVLVALQHATRDMREHPALQRLLETDPALLLHGLQSEFAALKAELLRVMEPMVSDFGLVRRGIVTPDQLIDWMLRLMISALLFPAEEADDMPHGITAIYQLLLASDAPPPPPAAPRARRTKKGTRR